MTIFNRHILIMRRVSMRISHLGKFGAFCLLLWAVFSGASAKDDPLSGIWSLSVEELLNVPVITFSKSDVIARFFGGLSERRNPVRGRFLKMSYALRSDWFVFAGLRYVSKTFSDYRTVSPYLHLDFNVTYELTEDLLLSFAGESVTDHQFPEYNIGSDVATVFSEVERQISLQRCWRFQV